MTTGEEVAIGRSRQMRRAGAVVMATTLVASCSSLEGNKAGGAGTPIVLRMATAQALPGSMPQVEYLVDRVEELSAGNVRIDMVYQVGSFALDAEPDVIRDVAAHRYDLGVVATQVFDTLGITSFRALTAPMLIDNYPLEQAVIDSDMPAEMMRSLDGLGVSGLGVLGGGLWKPIATEKPLRGPDDWRGISIVVGTPSVEESEAIRALGARPVDASHPSEGRTSSLLTYPFLEPREPLPYVTANVNLWPQPIAVVADPARLATLSSDQRGWLDEAVRDAATRSTELVNGDAGFLSNLCADGIRFANASGDDLADLQGAFAPLYADMEQDASTRDFIAEIRRLKAEDPSGEGLVIPADCTGQAPDSIPSPGLTDPGDTITTATRLDGVWDVTYSRDELAAAHPDPSEVDPSNYGHFTLEFHRGAFSFSQTDGGHVEWTLVGTYAVTDDAVTFFVAPNQAGTGFHGQEIWRYSWSVYRGTLTFEKLGGEAPDCSLNVSLGQCEPTGIVVKPWRQVSG
jgi:TRAP-type C4-dicarboxylate transport system substrate-binding protein